MQLTGHAANINALHTTTTLLATAAADGSCRVFDLRSGEKRRKIVGRAPFHEAVVFTLAYTTLANLFLSLFPSS